MSNYYIPHKLKFNNPHRAIAHDGEVYPDPFQFDPSRYLGDKPQLDPFKFVFGFGKRICPGIHLGELSLFLNMTRILALFNISKPVDEHGNYIEPEIDWTGSITSYVCSDNHLLDINQHICFYRHLRQFDCQIKPRSDEHLSLLERQLEE